MTRPIAGTLTADTYRVLANKHRPIDLTPEIRRLHGDGLTQRDIAAALHVPLSDVLDALANTSQEPNQ